MPAPRGLHTLARLHGVQTSYRSNEGHTVRASPQSIFAALAALRVPVRNGGDLTRRVEHRKRELWDRALEPVAVAWADEDGPRGSFTLRLPVALADMTARVTVGLEGGGQRTWSVELADAKRVAGDELAGRSYVALELLLPEDLPIGYHDLVVEVRRRRWDALLVCAPGRAPDWRAVVGDRAWGVFAPVHALWRERAGGPPDLSLVDELAERVAALGGAAVGTLPILAAFLDEPYEPSPYAPVSRLFWNELYLDPSAAPGFAESAEARAAHEAGGRAPVYDAGPSGCTYLDPRAALAARRPTLEALARWFYRDGEPAELVAFRARNPLADDYARFRALVEQGGAWQRWPDRLRARDVRPGDYDPALARYHVYVQWLAERQLAAVTERAASRGVRLYLDLPLGVHHAGYDVWRERALFAHGASAGAPPDPLARGGQDWGFPPLHPEASRLDRHRYFVACIRQHLRFGRVLRIDHIMQLHRLFWIPGGDARAGVYVRYPADELYAILCLEAQRAGAVIVGEDLGTVPAEVRRAMRRRGFPGMYVVQFEQRGPRGPRGEVPALKPVRPGSVASIGTHDLPTFAAWCARAADQVHTLHIRGLLGVLEQLLDIVGRSRAGLVLAALEDLWLETEPQNVPGTTSETNWRLRMRRPLEALDDPDVARLLGTLATARRQAR